MMYVYRFFSAINIKKIITFKPVITIIEYELIQPINQNGSTKLLLK